MDFPVISADSHVTEPPNTYVDYADPGFRNRAPRLSEEDEGVAFDIEGMGKFRIAVAAGAGVPPEQRTERLRDMSDLHRSGWDSSFRLADQDKDGVAAEIIYPTVGMILCNHPDIDYKVGCFTAYNRWIAEYCSIAPDRLLGVGQTAMRTPEEGIADIRAIKAAGLRGIMMPGVPGVEDYDSPIYDDFWAAAVENDIPLAFHILAVGGHEFKHRGEKVNIFSMVLRGVQDVIGMLIFGGVFERHPKLKIVCVEGDAGWLPHWGHRLDRAYVEHRHHLGSRGLTKMPSEYFFENIYFTFQDDPIAFRCADMMNWKRLMWANDFPHSDATWPHSQAILAEQTRCVTTEQKRAILCDNAAALYKIDLTGLDWRQAA